MYEQMCAFYLLKKELIIRLGVTIHGIRFNSEAVTQLVVVHPTCRRDIEADGFNRQSPSPRDRHNT